MEFVQLVIKTTTGNTVVRQPISWAWPGNRCMSQVTARNPHSTLGDAATADQSDLLECLKIHMLLTYAIKDKKGKECP